MSALVALMLAAADLTPPPVVEAPPPAPVPASEAKSKAPDVQAPPDEEWSLGAQISLSTVQSLNGIFLGSAVCGLAQCSIGGSEVPIGFAVVGAGTGLVLSLVDRDLARGPGRVWLINSATVLGGIMGAMLLARPDLTGMSQPLAFLTAIGADLLLTGASVWLAHRVSPAPEAIWLADTLGLWGLALGNSVASIFRRTDTSPFLMGGVLAGAVSGAMMGLSARQLDGWRVLLANAGAMLGALVLGGGLLLVETLIATPSRPFDPAVPSAGVTAGIAGGFLLGFVLSEER